MLSGGCVRFILHGKTLAMPKHQTHAVTLGSCSPGSCQSRAFRDHPCLVLVGFPSAAQAHAARLDHHPAAARAAAHSDVPQHFGTASERGWVSSGDRWWLEDPERLSAVQSYTLRIF